MTHSPNPTIWSLGRCTRFIKHRTTVNGQLTGRLLIVGGNPACRVSKALLMYGRVALFPGCHHSTSCCGRRFDRFDDRDESAVLRIDGMVYVPTRSDFAVMVGPDDPDAFLAAVRLVAPSQ